MMFRVLVLVAVVGGGMGNAEAKRPGWFNHAPEISETGFELPLRGLRASSLKRAKIHKAGKRELLVFLPGVRTGRRARRFKEGPIVSMKVRRVRRGAIMVLRTRGVFEDPKSRLSIVATKGGQLAFDASTVSAPAQEQAPEVLTVSAEAPAQDVGAATNKAKAVAKAEALPAPGEMKTFPWAARKAKGKATSPFKPAFSSRQSSMAASGMFGVLVLGLLTVFWAIRRKKTTLADVGSIEVVAVQSLGGKHKLALVQTCGERLLLATSDKEVRLLSHVGNSLIDESNFSDLSLSETRLKEWGNLVRQVDTKGEQETTPDAPEKPVMPRGTVGGNVGFAGAENLSSDLEGLVRLRKSQSESQNATTPSSSVAAAIGNPLTEQYRRDGAAA